jgi:hypothetical protein
MNPILNLNRAAAGIASTARTNELVDAVNALSSRGVGGSVGEERHSRQRHHALIWDKGPNGENDFDTHTYWLRRVANINVTADGIDKKARFQELPYDPESPDSWFPATNIAERPQLTGAENTTIKGTHLLRKGDLVAYWPVAVEDDDGPTLYEFSRSPSAFLARTVCRGPSNQPDFSNQMYWAIRVRITPDADPTKPLRVSAIPNTQANPTIIAVENLGERNAKSHLAPPGSLILVEARSDEQGGVHYVTESIDLTDNGETCPQPDPRYCIEEWEIHWSCFAEGWQDAQGEDASDPVLTSIECAEPPANVLNAWENLSTTGTGENRRTRYRYYRVSEYECTVDGEPCEPIDSGPPLPPEPADGCPAMHCYPTYGGYRNCDEERWEKLVIGSGEPTYEEIDNPVFLGSVCHAEPPVATLNEWFVVTTIEATETTPKRMLWNYVFEGAACDEEEGACPDPLTDGTGTAVGFPTNADEMCSNSWCYHHYLGYRNCDESQWEDNEGSPITAPLLEEVLCAAANAAPSDRLGEWIASPADCGPPHRVLWEMWRQGPRAASGCVEGACDEPPDAEDWPVPAFPESAAAQCNAGFTGDVPYVAEWNAETCEVTTKVMKFVNGRLMCITDGEEPV